MDTKDISASREGEPFPPTAHGLLQLPNYTCGLPSRAHGLTFIVMPKPKRTEKAEMETAKVSVKDARSQILLSPVCPRVLASHTLQNAT